MDNRKLSRKFATALLIPLTLVLVYASARTPAKVERIYSEGAYQPIGRFLSKTTGIIPISLAELVVIAVPLAFIVYTIMIFLRLFSQRSLILSHLAKYAANIVSAISLALFFFVMLWGLNYYRLPFAATAGLEVKPSSVDDLERVCISLIERANTLRTKASVDSDGNIDIPGTKRGILNDCHRGYRALSSDYPYLGGDYGNPKPVLLSELMNYTGICGVYFPFTGEANVNIAIPDVILPSTASHEMAHQRGFAREDEANFISYLACTAHPDVNYKYSGIILALTNSMNVLYKSDPSKYMELTKAYSPQVLKDLVSLSEFWKKYEGPVERTSDRMNNAYLKANNQKDGVKSYGRMVDLLIAEYNQKYKAD